MIAMDGLIESAIEALATMQVEEGEPTMSRSLNKVTLIGNLGADPEMRDAGGFRVATLSLATSESWLDGRGERREKTQWHRVICWNTAKGQQLADIAEKYCKKGEKVYIEGKIEYRSWDDKDGQKRYSTEINCRELILLGGRGDEGGEREPRRTAPPPRQTAAAKAPAFEDFPEALEADDDDGLPF